VFPHVEQPRASGLEFSGPLQKGQRNKESNGSLTTGMAGVIETGKVVRRRGGPRSKVSRSPGNAGIDMYPASGSKNPHSPYT